MPDATGDFNDRALVDPDETALPKPQIEIIVDGNSVFKPGMKTYFIDDYGGDSPEYPAKVMGEYCSCDTVTTTHIICTCEHVCTCESVCSCVGYSACTCVGNVGGTMGGTTCTCQSVSCGSPCACVPVH